MHNAMLGPTTRHLHGQVRQPLQSAIDHSPPLSPYRYQYVTVTNHLGAQAYWCTALAGPTIVQKPSRRRLGRLRTATGMAEELPGYIPRVLRYR